MRLSFGVCMHSGRNEASDWSFSSRVLCTWLPSVRTCQITARTTESLNRISPVLSGLLTFCAAQSDSDISQGAFVHPAFCANIQWSSYWAQCGTAIVSTILIAYKTWCVSFTLRTDDYLQHVVSQDISSLRQNIPWLYSVRVARIRCDDDYHR